MEQIVTNLLSNAVKYTDDGGQITLTAMREGDQAILRVRDTGIGISQAFLPRMFDLFAQGQRSVDREQGGLGIGLTLVRKLTAMHGGTVVANSAGIGEGSEFVVSLPVPDDHPLTPHHEERSRPPSRAEKPLRVIVVDDNVDAAESMKIVLALSGHEVRTAHNGNEAVALARADVNYHDELSSFWLL